MKWQKTSLFPWLSSKLAVVVYLFGSEEAMIKGMWPNRATMGPSNMKFGMDAWVSIRSKARSEKNKENTKRRECTVRLGS